MEIILKSRLAPRAVRTDAKLDSWKQIAAYVDRDPRTVQLWEKQEGLPIHRLAHNSRSSVYAYTAEVDAWIQARSVQNLAAAKEKPGARGAYLLSTRARRWAGSIVALGLVALLAGWYAAARKLRAEPGSSAALLAVLPFQNQTSDDSLADGVTDGLIADLGRIGKVRVISHQSVMEFKGSHLPVQQIAAQLHAPLLLRGSVADVGNQLQVTVELLGDSGAVHLWGATYSRNGGNHVARGDEIASAIAVDVTRRVAGSAPQLAFSSQAVDPRARQNYLTAKFYWNQRDLPGLQKAIALYGQALAIDTRYAGAYAGLAEAYDLMTDRGVLSEAEAFGRAKAAAQQALAIDPNSAEGYNALAFATYRQDWEFGQAEEYFRRALALDPNSSIAHQWYGEFLGDLRRSDESIAELRKAKELDPLSPMVGCDLADGYLHAGRLDEADGELRRVLELNPDFLYAHVYRVSILLSRGDFAAAEKEAQTYAQHSGDTLPLQIIEIERLAKSDQMKAARAALRRLQTTIHLTPYAAAQLYFATGQTEAGYAALDRAYHQHSWWLVTMLVDPRFAPVRAQPRFLRVAGRVGLPLKDVPEELAYDARAKQ